MYPYNLKDLTNLKMIFKTTVEFKHRGRSNGVQLFQVSAMFKGIDSFRMFAFSSHKVNFDDPKVKFIAMISLFNQGKIK